MISDRASYRYYLKRDLQAYGFEKLTLYNYLRVDCLRFQRRLRKVEYLFNVHRKSRLIQLYRVWLEIRNHRLATRLGLTIPKNVFGPGLCIVHHGTIVVNPEVKVGKNCRIHPSSSIGDYGGVPQLGDNVYIGPGAQLFGDISIGDNVVIGANAVVNKSFPSNVTGAGVPAKTISEQSSLEADIYPEKFLKNE